MARAVAGDFLRDATPIFSPVARPTDTFVQPGRPAQSGAEALTSALAGLDQAINPILLKERKKRHEREIAEGQQLFQQNRADFGDAVRSGAIPAGASPYVRKGYRTSQLHALGANYSVELARSLEESQIYKVDDPAQIEEFVGGFHNKFLEENALEGFDTVEMASVFTPMVQKAHDGFRQRQAEKNIDFIATERFSAFENEGIATIDMHNFDGSESEVANSLGITGAYFEAKAAELDGEGHDRTKISRSIVDTVVAAAEAEDDLDILDILENVQLGTAPLMNTKYGRLKADRAEERILAARRSRQAAARSANAAAERKLRNDRSLSATIAAESGTDEEYEEALSQVTNAADYRAIQGHRQSDLRNDRDTKQRGYNTFVHEQLRRAGTVDEIRDVADAAVDTGLLNHKDIITLENHYSDRLNPEDEALRTFRDDKVLHSGLDELLGTIRGVEDESSITRDRAAQANFTYELVMDEWYRENRREDGSYSLTAAIDHKRKLISNLRDEFIDEGARSELAEQHGAGLDAIENPAPPAPPPAPPSSPRLPGVAGSSDADEAARLEAYLAQFNPQTGAQLQVSVPPWEAGQ